MPIVSDEEKGTGKAVYVTQLFFLLAFSMLKWLVHMHEKVVV